MKTALEGEVKAVGAAVREALRDAPPTAANVLIVDDDPRNLLATAAFLNEPGWRVVQARSGDEALHHLLLDDFAVILLDVQMPGLDGYATAELIRGREKTRALPIIFVTAVNKEAAQVFRGYQAGAVDYVFKPVDPLILKSKVAVFVELYRKSEAIRRQAALEARLMQENFRIRLDKARADQALRRTEEQQALIIRSLPVAIWVDPLVGGRVGTRRYVAGDLERLSGHPAARFTVDDGLWCDGLDEHDRARVIEELGDVLASGAGTVEYAWRRADGERRYFLDQALMLKGEGRRTPEMVGTTLDITQRKELEQQLAQAQKLESLGKLTGGIAHDFNNMLSIVIGNLDLVYKSITDPATARRAKSALDGALRCAEMTQRLLTFARRRPFETKAVDLAGLVPTVVELLRRTVDERIAIRLEVADGLWPVRSDAAQIEAAIVNLALNARDAMPDGGELAIRLANMRLAQGELDAGDYVEITVRDTGTGMPPDVLKRAFEPFFTTKDVGKGTGLGLSTTYGFIKESRGHIEIDSTPGAGTSVRILLPRAEGGERAPEEEEPRRGSPDRTNGETILVVEDDASVREVAVSALAQLGYRVLEAADAETGLDLLQRDGGICLLFTDLLMPGPMNGRELAQEALRRRPGLKVLYVSGYGGNAELLDEKIGLIRKPYRGEDLAGRVRAILDDVTVPAEAE
jgi:signal transduction histidine kinase/two-component SAPR family response regulator